MTAGAEEPSALIQLERPGGRSDPNLRATEIELYRRPDRESQNRWPSLGFDVGAVNDLLSPFLPAGFYYKTFLWPASWWTSVYEPFIRRAAGLGRAPTRPDPDRYLHRHAHCDVLVVGAGPAGLMAALAAGRSGARVILVEREAELGGSLLGESGTLADFDGRAGDAWLPTVVAELEALPEVTVLRRTNAFGYLDHNYLVLHERVADHLPSPPPNQPRQRAVAGAGQAGRAGDRRHRAAAGVPRQRPAGRHAGQRGAHLPQPLSPCGPGSRAVVFTNNDSAYAAALDLAQRRRRDRGHRRPARARPTAHCRAAAAGGRPADPPRVGRGRHRRPPAGRPRLGLADAGRRQPRAGRAPGAALRLPADLGRLEPDRAPVLAVARQAALRRRGCRLRAGPVGPAGAFGRRRQRQLRPGGMLRRRCAAPGRKPPRQLASRPPPPSRPSVREPAQEPLLPTWAVPSHVAPSRAKAFVDFQNDVTAKDLGPRRARGLPVDRARQALHHHRHGHRPGQDQQRQCAGDRGRQARHPDRGRRHHHLPHALHAGHLRRARRPARRRAVRPDPPHAEPRLGRRRRAPCSRMSATGSARATSREPARTCTPPSSANAWPCAAVSACSTPARWARSTCRARTAPSSSTASTPTPGPSSRSAAAATG